MSWLGLLRLRIGVGFCLKFEHYIPYKYSLNIHLMSLSIPFSYLYQAAMQEEMRDLLSKLEAAEDQLEKRQSEEDDASTLKQELVSIQSIMDEQVRTLTDQLAVMESQLKEKEGQLSAIEKSGEEEKETMRNHFEEESKFAKSKIEELETRLKDQRNEMLRRAEEEARAKNDANELAAVDMYKEQLVAVQAEADELKAEGDRLKAEVARLTSDGVIAVEDLRKTKSSLLTAEASVAELTTGLEEMTRANEEMGEKYLKALEENSEKESGVMARLHNIEEQKAEVEEEKTRLENKLEDKRRNEQLINKKLADMEIAKQEQVRKIRSSVFSPFLVNWVFRTGSGGLCCGCFRLSFWLVCVDFSLLYFYTLQCEKIAQLEEKQKDHESQVAEWSSRELAMETALLQKEGVQRDLQKQVEVLTIRHTEAQNQVSYAKIAKWH